MRTQPSRLPHAARGAACAWPLLAALAGVLLAGPTMAETPTTVLHAFSLTDGADPQGSLIAIGDSLYGMTNLGGVGGGVIYRINKDGSGFSVLHEFTSGAGYLPFGALAEVGGKLFGMTYGTTNSDMKSLLFSIFPDGSDYQVLYELDYRTEGGYAHGSPVYHNGYLYGFTGGGGPGSRGTIFRYDLGADTLGVLHVFSQYAPADGESPFGSPLIVDDSVYGMTYAGGSGAGVADGVLFRMDLDGSAYQVLHDFARNDADNGVQPFGDLVAVGDYLFGLTSYGGSATDIGLGTVFRIHKTGTGFEILHRFLGTDYNPEGDDDGQHPYGSLTPHGAYLYGMTAYGGSNGQLQGTIFRIQPDGSGYEVLHNFAGGTADGKRPYYCAPLCEGGMLYAQTRQGGTVNDHGAVIAMAIDPPVAVPDAPPAARGPRLAVGPPFPNPGRAGAGLVLPVQVPAPDAVTLDLYTLSGRLLASRAAERLGAPGRHEIRWELPALPAGGYYIRVRTAAGLEGGTQWIVLH